MINTRCGQLLPLHCQPGGGSARRSLTSLHTWRQVKAPQRPTTVARFVPTLETAVKEQAVDQTAQTDQKLNWKDRWYAAAVVQDLDRSRPTPITILGQRLVLWHDGNDWRAFEDHCPHRSVALSEGRIHDGKLQCSYHGWDFNGEGKCVHVPQAWDEKTQTRTCNAKRSAATAFPTTEKSGLLYVWMVPGGEAHLRAMQTEVPDEGAPDGPWYRRDVPMSWQVLMENITDPAHVPHSHHGVEGDRNSPMKLEFKNVELMGSKGWRVKSEWTPPRGKTTGGIQQILDFIEAPTTYSIKLCFPANGDAPKEEWKAGPPAITLLFQTVPVTPSTSRVFLGFQTPFMKAKAKKNILAKLTNYKPKWLDHLRRSAVLDGDAVFLHQQSQDMLSGKRVRERYFLPTASDTGTRTLYKFLEQHSPKGIDFYPDALQEGEERGYWPREQILDRHGQHVQHCKMCSDVLKRVQFGMKAAQILGGAAVATCAALLTLGRPLPVAPLALWAVAVGVCAAGWRGLRALEKRLTFADYVHAER